jgi:dihydrofolate reductase
MFKIIVAHAPNRVIGNGIHIPWHIKEEFQHFKRTTLGHTIIMGSTTFLSIGKPLPNRKTIVINQDPNFDTMGQELCTDLNEVISKYKDSEEVVFVCGGASIYRQMLPYVNEMIISVVKKEVEGNIYFPEYENDFEVYEEVEYDEFTVKYMRRK